LKAVRWLRTFLVLDQLGGKQREQIRNNREYVESDRYNRGNNANQNEKDHAALKRAIRAGKVKARYEEEK